MRGKLGERLANSIANALKLKHIKEYRESHPQEKKEEATPAPQASSKEDQQNDERNKQTHRQCP